MQVAEVESCSTGGLVARRFGSAAECDTTLTPEGRRCHTNCEAENSPRRPGGVVDEEKLFEVASQTRRRHQPTQVSE